MATNQSKLNPELVEWLAARQKSLQVVKTTKAPRGTTLDWVPIESQALSRGIATPPPNPPARGDRTERKPTPVAFELDESWAELGPAGTVPLVRPNIALLTRRIVHKDYLSKRGGRRFNPDRRTKSPADPDPANYFHNTDSQWITAYGWDGYLNVWSPTINVPAGGNGEDHSIVQVWLQNYDKVQQSIEGGWTVDKGLNGDLLPHVFTYFTTNGYAEDGDDLGGYNSLNKGWVQYSSPSTTGRTVFPGIAITTVSNFDGPQFDIGMKFQLYKEPGSGLLNWWVGAEGVWMGYYPASLFSNGGLGSLVQWVGAGGEIYSGLKDPEATQDQMGSGLQAAAGWGRAAYLRNLRIQSDMSGTMVDNNGTASSDAAVAGGADPYTIEMGMNSGGSWGSYIFVGGPTQGPDDLAIWKTNDGPLPKGVWDGKQWDKQHSRASNDKLIEPPHGSSASIRFVIIGTTDNVDEISFNVAIDRAGSDKTCWKDVVNSSIESLGTALEEVHLTLAEANQRGFYICEVKGATQPFDVVAQFVS